MIESWLNAFWFFLPAGFANMAPIIGNKIPYWNRWKTPMDFGKSFRGQRILGNNKSWRGFVSGVILAGIVAAIESPFIYHALPDDHVWFVLAGMAMGAGALLGDAVESFFKRQAKVAPGESWFPFDQIDYILGGLLVVLPFIAWNPVLLAQVFLLYFGLHVVVVFVAYKLGLRDKPI